MRPARRGFPRQSAAAEAQPLQSLRNAKERALLEDSPLYIIRAISNRWIASPHTQVARLRILRQEDASVVARHADDWPAFWQRFQRLLGGHNIRAVQEDMGHRSIKSTLRYQACILPSATSPLDPESQNMVVRQMNVLLGRLSMALPALHPTKPQGP